MPASSSGCDVLVVRVDRVQHTGRLFGRHNRREEHAIVPAERCQLPCRGELVGAPSCIRYLPYRFRTCLQSQMPWSV
jgi:hypothetical protein